MLRIAFNKSKCLVLGLTLTLYWSDNQPTVLLSQPIRKYPLQYAEFLFSQYYRP